MTSNLQRNSLRSRWTAVWNKAARPSPSHSVIRQSSWVHTVAVQGPPWSEICPRSLGANVAGEKWIPTPCHKRPHILYPPFTIQTPASELVCATVILVPFRSFIALAPSVSFCASALSHLQSVRQLNHSVTADPPTPEHDIALRNIRTSLDVILLERAHQVLELKREGIPLAADSLHYNVV